MAITACPATVVGAPVETVWELLAESTLYDQWWDMHTERIVPAGPAAPGQVLYGTSPGLGRHWDVRIAVELVTPDKHQVRLLATLPFGITNQATITCRPRDSASCLVQFGWDFTLPPGWRGWLLGTFGSRAIEAGVADALQRLKRAAEARYRNRVAREAR